jgi:hypothetical protein
MYDTSFIQKGYFWSDTPFRGFTFSGNYVDVDGDEFDDEYDNVMSLYAHTHFVVDDEDFGKSFSDVMCHSSKRSIYKNIFEITNDKFGLCNFTLELPNEQTLVSSHTIWRVQEHTPYADINSQRLITPTTFTLVENNNRIELSRA